MDAVCYGKLPLASDFITIGDVDGEFPVLREWLHGAFLSASGMLIEGWNEAYRVAPMWRFSASAGVFGKHAMIGLMSPSADRVGRLFPVIVATSADCASEAWYGATENLLFDVFSARILSSSEFERQLKDTRASMEGVPDCSTNVLDVLTAGNGRLSVWQAQGAEPGKTRLFRALPSGSDMARLFASFRDLPDHERSPRQNRQSNPKPLIRTDVGSECLLALFTDDDPVFMTMADTALSALCGPCELAHLLLCVQSLYEDIQRCEGDRLDACETPADCRGIAAIRVAEDAVSICFAGQLSMCSVADGFLHPPKIRSTPLACRFERGSDAAIRLAIGDMGTDLHMIQDGEDPELVRHTLQGWNITAHPRALFVESPP